MKKIVLSASIALLLGAGLAAAADKPAPNGDENARQGASVSPVFSLELIPQLSLPVGRDSDVFTLGGGASLMARIPLPLHFLALEAGGGFEWAPIGVAQGKGISNAGLMLLWPWAGVAFEYDLFRSFTIGASVSGGYYFGSVNADVPNNSGHNPMLSAGAGLRYRLLPNLSVRVAAFYRNFLGLYNDVAFSVGTSYHFLPRQETLLKLRPYTNLRLDKVELEQVFPVMYKYYDDHPVGTVTITNTGKIPLENLAVSLFVNQYMDNPKVGTVIPFVRGGDTLTVDLFALFNDRVMGISEATKVQASVSVALSVAGENYGNEKIETLRIYDRNALAWIDDRRVAAFIVAKDPTVMRFAKNVASAINDKISGIYDSALLRALALHEALSIYGIAYQIDPSSPYSDEAKKSGAVDYLQFPSQTLEFKAGDCDDLTILNASLLESLGVETAFITVPGHIYMAFALDMSAEEAIKRFHQPESLILRAGKAWLPVEITMTQAGFVKAWETGAQEWRENDGRGQAKLFPTHDAWKLYEPVGFTRDLAPVKLPDDGAVLEAFKKEMDRFVDHELSPQAAALQEKIRTQNDPRLGNSLGVLYARFGRSDKAEAEFMKVLALKEYAPALANLGNLAFMAGDMAKARGYLERANKVQGSNPRILLNLSRACYELKDYRSAAASYDALKQLDATLAARFAYLDASATGAGSTSRASEAERTKPVVEWSE